MVLNQWLAEDCVPPAQINAGRAILEVLAGHLFELHPGQPVSVERLLESPLCSLRRVNPAVLCRSARYACRAILTVERLDYGRTSDDLTDSHGRETRGL